MRTNAVAAAILLMMVFLPVPVKGALGADWTKAVAADVTLFYPGVASWEFLTSDDHRLGGREIKQARKDCRHCHLGKGGELDLKADEIAAGSIKMKRSHNPFEPEPLPGKKGIMSAKAQAAYDDEFLYVKVEWESRGAGWSKGSKKSDRVSLQINKAEPTFKKYGCFITCHNDLNTMPESPSKKEVSANPYYGGQQRDDVRLYAYYARSAWDQRKPEGELSKKLKDGGRIDLVSIEFENGSATAFDGWVFDDRRWEDKAGDATGTYSKGKYSAEFKLKLKSKDQFDADLSEGDVVSIGMAVHDDGASKRKHYVSFPFTIGLGVAADIKAEKTK